MDSRFKEFKRGNEKAFRHYFDLYSRAICDFAFAYCKSEMEAQDIAQECFVILFTNRQQINDEEHLKLFLFKTARYRLIDHQRSMKNRKNREFIWMEAQQAWDQQQDEFELVKALVLSEIYKLSKRMPARRREIFGLYFYEHMDVRAIARCIGLKESTVYSHLQHAYSFLIKEMPDPTLLIWVILLFFGVIAERFL
ncbi:RNA polymerase sigma factor [Puia dinghuensis]|uniref:RNA polymerase sigma-70 factor n=1 Tax=Puia dinghuensis TaxID=1792502 RepID=A0A8J2UIW6_9BACT|nr:sigma-70 family RNA polymerase sigma factor [Puia dinghuensis]GGB23599.1 hypothetical protein GCM10011511_54320 [Puia dinghuensis]